MIGRKAGAEEIGHLSDPYVFVFVWGRCEVEDIGIGYIIVRGLGWFSRLKATQVVRDDVLDSGPVLDLKIIFL